MKIAKRVEIVLLGRVGEQIDREELERIAADPKNAGQAINLLEYSLVLDPLTEDGRSIPKFWIITDPHDGWDSGDGSLAARLTRISSAVGDLAAELPPDPPPTLPLVEEGSEHGA